jgi:hypothetical protein
VLVIITKIIRGQDALSHTPDRIITFDWATIVVDKLVTSIAKYKQTKNSCTTAALGGCTFAMMV